MTLNDLKAEFASTSPNGNHTDTDQGHGFADWIRTLDWESFWGTDDTPANDWAIEPLLPAGRQVAVWSRAKVGKSLLALDIAAAAATGRSVLGQPPAPPVHVLYLDLEMGPDDLRERLLDLGYGPGIDLKHLHYCQQSSVPPLDVDLGGNVVADAVKRDQAAIVIVDTMARAVAGDENSSDTFRNFYKHCGTRLRTLGASLLVLDHGGKDSRQGQRGSSAKDDALDVVWELTSAGSVLTVRRTRSRVAWVPAEIKIRREDEPRLRHVLAPVDYPAGTAEVSNLLDELGLPADVSRRVASAALQNAGQGRRTEVVTAALKYRNRPR